MNRKNILKTHTERNYLLMHAQRGAERMAAYTEQCKLLEGKALTDYIVDVCDKDAAKQMEWRFEWTEFTTGPCGFVLIVTAYYSGVQFEWFETRGSHLYNGSAHPIRNIESLAKWLERACKATICHCSKSLKSGISPAAAQAARDAQEAKVLDDIAAERAPASIQPAPVAKPDAPRTRSAQSPVDLANFHQIRGLFDSAEGKLQNPKIRLMAEDGTPVVLSLAKSHSANAGFIYVAGDRDADRYYGKISGGGVFYSTSQCTKPVVALLRSLDRDAVGVATAYGRKTGACCFCGLKLTDQRSVSVGYGPICAGNYGLPWGISSPDCDEMAEEGKDEQRRAQAEADDEYDDVDGDRSED